MDENNSSNAFEGFLFLFVFFIILLIIFGGCGGGYYYYQCKKKGESGKQCKCEETFEDMPLEESTNPLYNTGFLYTQPSGDVMAQYHGQSGQGTDGEYLPLQGQQAGTFMKNSSVSNGILPTPNNGEIGGYPNYTTKNFDLSWIGFQNFPGSPETNSYLIQGANERVCNPGQKCDNLSSPNWWPTVKKDNKGYAVQGSDLLATCSSATPNINTCEEGRAFTQFKNEDQYKKVLNN